MSEYQYYEFAAIDRPLKPAEMAKLRTVSTRAEITSVSFINHYEWGDLKARPADWMQRYFDAFVYTGNSCSCYLSLRVPLETFSKGELKFFTTRNALACKATKTHWIVDWSLDESEDYDRFALDDGSHWMRRLVPLRDELLRGDLRPLYLGWLAAAGRGELEETESEPELPPGLGSLSPAQIALVAFLEIDADMLTAAQAGSAKSSTGSAARGNRLDAWLKEWSRDEMAAVLKLIAKGEAQAAERQVRSRHAAWAKAQHPSHESSAPRRTVKQLRELARPAPETRAGRKRTNER